MWERTRPGIKALPAILCLTDLYCAAFNREQGFYARTGTLPHNREQARSYIFQTSSQHAVQGFHNIYPIEQPFTKPSQRQTKTLLLQKKTTRRSLILGTLVKLFRSAKTHARIQEQQFMALLSPHIELMYRMAYRWTRSEADAEDIVQDVLIRLADRVDEMLQIEQLRPWLIKCVYRRFVDLYRSRESNPLQAESSLFGLAAEMDDEAPSLASLQADPRDDYAQLDDREALLKALETLDDDQRDVILLHDAEGYSASEVAEILEEHIGTVKSRLHRARNKLKIFLAAGTF